MLELRRMRRSVGQIMATTAPSAEEYLALHKKFSPIIRFQESPDMALICLTGIFLTPHQRSMLYLAHRGAAVNVNVSSRGTAKSATWCVLYAAYKGQLFAKRKIVELSAAGFRGGQLILNDMEKWLDGGWVDQDAKVDFFRKSVSLSGGKNIIHKAQNFWEVDFHSWSNILVLPTNDPDRIRGVRATDVFIDEANTFDADTIQAVILPFLNVQADFRYGGARAVKNAVYYTTTIDQGWREFQKTVQAAKDGLARDYAIVQARKRHDKETAGKLEVEGFRNYTYSNFDYSDTIVRRYQHTRDGLAYEVVWPNPELEWEDMPRGIPFTERDPENGQMKREGSPVEAMRTYPINKDDLESSLLDNATSEEIWLSEQRNVVDQAAGDVYPHLLLERMSNSSNFCVIPYKNCPEDWQRAYAAEERDFSPTILWECKDPCVMGVDYAGGDRDFFAVVVIRVGSCAKGDFNPFTQQGKTKWSNVVWCEQHRLTTHRQAAEKIRALMSRYNIVHHFDIQEKDDWKLCRGIGLDMKGGGQGVRDVLVFIDDAEPPAGQKRVYDPLDRDSRIQAYLGKDDCLPVLDAIQPSAEINDRCVEYTLTLMKSGQLYLPKWYEESQRPNPDKALNIGYLCSRILRHQLSKIQQEPMQNYRKFYMPGDTEKVENKKDLFSAWLYATKQARTHLIRQQMIDNAPPPMGALSVRINSQRGKHNGRSPGAKGF